MDPHDAECSDVHDDLALMAVGTLTGRRRAQILAHLEGCTGCSAELEELSTAADALITLIPEAIPPEGFAERTTALMRAERRAPSLPSIRRLTAAAAFVVVLGVGFGVGSIVSSGGSGHIAAALTTAIHSPTGAYGSVTLTPGQDSWLVMTLNDAPTSGSVACSVTLTDGTRRAVGHFTLSDGYGSWAAPLPVAASAVRSVEVVDHKGATIATARLSA